MTLIVDELRVDDILNEDGNAHFCPVLLLSGEITSAVSSFDIDFETAASGYDVLILELIGFQCTTDNANVQLTLSDDSGSTFEATNYIYAGSANSSAPADNEITSTGDTKIQVMAGVGNAADESGCSITYFYNFSDTATYKPNFTQAVTTNSSGNTTNRTFFWSWDGGTTAYDQFRIAPSAGNIDYGRWYLYGVKE